MRPPPQIFDEALVVERLRRAARAADAPDFLLHRVADDFVERLATIRRSFQAGACLGAYNGLVSRKLREAGIGQMADVEAFSALPFAPHSLDLIVSGLALHLVNDVPGVLAQVRRALKPDGLFLAALLGGETLTELRQSWLVAEESLHGGASPRVAPFADVRELGALLQRAEFALPVADSDVVTVTYASPLHLMRELKAMGASNALADRRRVPVTRELLFKAAEVYVDRYGLANGRVPATFEIMTLTGWAPHESQQKPLAPGSAKMRLEDALNPIRADREAKE